MKTFKVKDNFNNFISFAWNQYNLFDSMIFGLICILLQVLMYLGAYLKNPKYVGKYDSFLDFFSSLYWTEDFYYLDKALILLAILMVTPLRSFLSFKAWNVVVEFNDVGIIYKNEVIPFVDFKRVIAVKDHSIALQHRKKNEGLFKVIPFPGLNSKNYKQIKEYIIWKNPNVYFHEVKYGFQSLTPPRDKNWPQV